MQISEEMNTVAEATEPSFPLNYNKNFVKILYKFMYTF
jgi:hypothetical protein